MRPSPTPSRNRRHRCRPASLVLLLGLAATTALLRASGCLPTEATAK